MYMTVSFDSLKSSVQTVGIPMAGKTLIKSYRIGQQACKFASDYGSFLTISPEEIRCSKCWSKVFTGKYDKTGETNEMHHRNLHIAEENCSWPSKSCSQATNTSSTLELLSFRCLFNSRSSSGFAFFFTAKLGNESRVFLLQMNILLLKLVKLKIDVFQSSVWHHFTPRL